MKNLSGANLNSGTAVGPQGEGRVSPSSFSSYPAYKDSGVEWLGDVPEGWSVASLRFFADLITGITPPSDDLSNYAEEGWSWVRPEDLDDSGKPVLASKFLTNQGWAFCRKVKGHSTLICCIGTIGKLGFTEADACTNQQITAVVPRQGGKFYFYAMHALKPAFDAYATGNVLRILNSERLGSVEVAVPSTSEAESIVRFLDHETARIDALIEEQQRLIELLKEKRQAVISHAVTQGLDPTVPMKDSGVKWLGEVPAHWVVIKLGLITSERCDGPFGSALKSEHYTDWGVRVVRLQNIKSGWFSNADSAFIDNEYFLSNINKSHVLPGDVLIAGLGDDKNPVGRACVAPENLGCAMVKADCFRFRLLPQAALSEFVALQLTSGAVADAGILSTGSTRSRIPLSTMSTRIVALPTITEQKAVIQFVQEVNQQLDSLFSEAKLGIELLQERSSALISAAVTGKIDVRGWQPPVRAQTPELEQETV